MKNRLSALIVWILVAVLSMGTASSALARHDQMQNGQSSEGDPTGGLFDPMDGSSAGGAAESLFQHVTDGKCAALFWVGVPLLGLWPACNIPYATAGSISHITWLTSSQEIGKQSVKTTGESR